MSVKTTTIGTLNLNMVREMTIIPRSLLERFCLNSGVGIGIESSHREPVDLLNDRTSLTFKELSLDTGQSAGRAIETKGIADNLTIEGFGSNSEADRCESSLCWFQLKHPEWLEKFDLKILFLHR